MLLGLHMLQQCAGRLGALRQAAALSSCAGLQITHTAVAGVASEAVGPAAAAAAVAGDEPGTSRPAAAVNCSQSPSSSRPWPEGAAAAVARPAGQRRWGTVQSRGLASQPEPAAAPASSSGGQPSGAAPPRNCWQCGTSLAAADLFFCPHCHSIQPATSDPEYFQVFGLDEAQFDVDTVDLEARYKALQRRLHPDKFSTASQLEQEYSDQQAAVVNQAYHILRAPLRRAHYLLQRKGLGACEGMTITHPELLMYVMEAREEVESAAAGLQRAAAAGEYTAAAAARGRLEALLEENRRQEARCVGELQAAFAVGALEEAAALTTQLRYVTRIQEAIIDKL